MFRRIFRRMTVLVVLGLAGLALSASAGLAAKPPGMSDAEYAALMARSDALNKQYGLGQYVDRARNEALNRQYGNDWTQLSPVEFKALVDQFGPDVTTMSLSELRARVASSSSAGGGFDWGDAGIGGAALAGALLLAAAAAVRVRQHRPHPA